MDVLFPLPTVALPLLKYSRNLALHVYSATPSKFCSQFEPHALLGGGPFVPELGPVKPIPVQRVGVGVTCRLFQDQSNALGTSGSCPNRTLVKRGCRFRIRGLSDRFSGS